jgi:hypothetical protein
MSLLNFSSSRPLCSEVKKANDLDGITECSCLLAGYSGLDYLPFSLLLQKIHTIAHQNRLTGRKSSSIYSRDVLGSNLGRVTSYPD